MSEQKIILIPLDRLDFAPQVRKRFDEEELSRLAQSIAALGVQQPIQVRPAAAGRFVVLNGERRCRSSSLAGLTAVPAQVIEGALEAAEIIERQLAVNHLHVDLSPVEVARGIDRLLKEPNRTAAAVAMSQGTSPATISRLLALLRLPAAIQERIEEGAIGASFAAELAKIDDPAEQLRLADEAASGRLTRDGLVALARDRGNAGKSKAGRRNRSAGRKRTTPEGSSSEDPQLRVTLTLGDSRSITLAGPGLSNIDTLIEWLTELLGEARKARSQNLGLSTFTRILRDRADAPPSPSQARGA
ncbi:MAG: ParB/RepB/Spo0J family partition protein [Phycisphaerae bacterium]|nr:ParB/RepB/Spo0J family partition protein [Phycisphaerae bacterium]